MRSYLMPTLVAGALGVGLLAGCNSPDEQSHPTESSAAPATTSTTTESAPPTAAPGQVATSPGGVTTAVGAQAQSTEDEYFRACHAAKMWIDEKGGDPKAQIEPYLASLQAPDAVPGPGTYNIPWAQLTPERQSAAIVAVQAAADDLCG